MPHRSETDPGAALATPPDHRPLRSAVVGAGAIAEEHLGFLSGSPRAELVAVCDLSPAAARYAGRTYGAGSVHTDVATMLEAVAPEVVHVLTPPATHLDLARRCLARGAHVIVEKPATLSADDLDALLADARASGRRVIENHNYRFNSEVLLLDELVASGRLGPIREVGVRLTLPIRDPSSRFGDPNLPSPVHQLPGGAVHDFITHLAYLLDHFSPHVTFDRVSALWSNRGGGELFTYDDLDATLAGRGPDGLVHGHVRFDARSSPSEFTITLHGDTGYAEVELYHHQQRVVVPRAGGGQLSPIANQLANGIDTTLGAWRNLRGKVLRRSAYEGLHRFLDRTYLALATENEPPVNEGDMRRTAHLIDALLEERSVR
jgi:predicted dehydrogenase